MDIIVLDILDTLRNFIYYANDSQFVLTLKIVGALFSIVFGILVVLLVFKLQIVDGWFKNAGDFFLTKAFPKRNLNKSWQKILTRLNQSDEASLRLALIEADNLFDDLLKQMRLPGESMADRLRYLNSSQIPNIDEIWRAHKLRNVIVHNHEYPITRNEIDFGVHAYEKALKDLEFID